MEPLERWVPATGTALQKVLAAAGDREAALEQEEAEAEEPGPPDAQTSTAQPSTSGP